MDKTYLDPAIFRAYDIRGIVNENLHPQTLSLIGQALGSILIEQHENEAAIAYDGRLSSPMLAAALAQGLQNAGCHVIDYGMIPTPLLYYGATQLQSRSGFVVTGSHNPTNYNGLKMVLRGQALAEAGIQQLYQRILKNNLLHGKGSYTATDIRPHYINEIIQQTTLTKPLKIVIDAGNGVAGELAPALFKALGCEVIPLFCNIDGYFPHHHPDPSQIENLQELIRIVRTEKADIGFAFDGDGDRLGVVTNKGTIILPDRVLMFFAQSLLATHPHAKIIYDVKCTAHLDPFIRALKGEPIMWKTGHSYIKAKMAEPDVYLAGEMSGHFFFKDKWYGFDDAIYAAARLVSLLATETENSETIFNRIPNSINTPELKISVPDAEKFQIMQSLITQAKLLEAKEIITIDGLRMHFQDGWGLIRVSNTTPNLILRFEAATVTHLEYIQNLFRRWLLTIKPDLVMSF